MLANSAVREQARSHKLGVSAMQLARRIVSQFGCHGTRGVKPVCGQGRVDQSGNQSARRTIRPSPPAFS